MKKTIQMAFCVFTSFASTCCGHSLDHILVEARNNMLECSSSTGTPNNVKWEAFLANVRADIMQFNNIVEAIHFGQDGRRSGFDHRSLMSLQNLREEEKSLKQEFPQFSQSVNQVSDSPYSIYCANDNGRLISNMLHYHYRYILKILTYIHNPSIVCQIGGGYGGVERLWLTNPVYHPNVCIIIDYPESLFFAEVFLKSNFINNSSVEVIYLKDSMNSESLDVRKKTVILCPIGKEVLLDFPIDLVMNTGSLQEMTDPWVDYWMEWLDRGDIKYFYSLNYGADSITTRKAEVLGATTWAPRLSNKWDCLLNSCTPFLCQYAGFAEIFAVKGALQPSRQELATIFDNSWRNRKNDAQAILDCLDVVRRLPETQVLWELLRRIFEESTIIPRETYFLVKLLKSTASQDFLKQHAVKIQQFDDFISLHTKDLE